MEKSTPFFKTFSWSFMQNIFNWITIAVWVFAIWGFWGIYNARIEENITRLLSLGLVIQGIAYIDFRKFYREKEFYYLVILLALSIVCLILNHSAMGSFLLIFNLCAIWYLSNRWNWSKLQITCFSLFLFIILATRIKNPNYNVYNSNSIGIIMFLITFNLIATCEFFLKERKVIHAIQIVLIVICAYQMVLSRCRTGLLTIAFWGILHYAVLPKWKNHPRFYPICYWVTHIMTGLFVASYTAASFHFANKKMFFNKNLFSGRDIIWYALWEAYREHILIGCGSNVQLPVYGTLSAHNSLFNILAVFGLIVFIPLVLYIGYKIQKISSGNKTPLLICVFDFIIALYVECIFETTLLWAPTVLLWVFPLIILNSKNDEEKILK